MTIRISESYPREGLAKLILGPRTYEGKPFPIEIKETTVVLPIKRRGILFSRKIGALAVRDMPEPIRRRTAKEHALFDSFLYAGKYMVQQSGKPTTEVYMQVGSGMQVGDYDLEQLD